MNTIIPASITAIVITFALLRGLDTNTSWQKHLLMSLVWPVAVSVIIWQYFCQKNRLNSLEDSILNEIRKLEEKMTGSEEEKEPVTVFCPKCGQEHPEGTEVCPECGVTIFECLQKMFLSSGKTPTELHEGHVKKAGNNPPPKKKKQDIKPPKQKPEKPVKGRVTVDKDLLKELESALNSK